MSFIDPHNKDIVLNTYKSEHIELVLLEQWCTTLRLNKSIYSNASRYYARLGNILTIIGGIAKALAGATVLTAALADTFHIPQHIITFLTISFIILSTIITVIVDSMGFKPKSILYEETSKACGFLIKEIEVYSVNTISNRSNDFDTFTKMIKSWNTMITSRAGKVPERIISMSIANHDHTNIVLEVFKSKVSNIELKSIKVK